MGEIVAVALIVIALKMAVDRGVQEYGHVRDRHLSDIQKAHPDWSPRRQRRLAKHRARGYWAEEIARGFPTMRGAFKENRELAKVERAEADAAGEKRLAELRQRLDAAHAKREKYVADAVKKDPTADKAKLRAGWLRTQRLGNAVAAGTAVWKAQGGNGTKPADSGTPDAPTGGKLATKPDAKPSRTPKPPVAEEPKPKPAPAGTIEHRCRGCGVKIDGAEDLCGGCGALLRADANIENLRRRRDQATGDARADLERQIEAAERNRDELRREASTRRAALNGHQAPRQRAAEPGSGTIGTNGAAPLVRCQRCHTHVPRLYPDGDLAVCSECADLSHARQRLTDAREQAKELELQVAGTDDERRRARLGSDLEDARRREARAELTCRRGLKAAEERRAAAARAETPIDGHGHGDSQPSPPTGSAAPPMAVHLEYVCPRCGGRSPDQLHDAKGPDGPERVCIGCKRALEAGLVPAATPSADGAAATGGRESEIPAKRPCQRCHMPVTKLYEHNGEAICGSCHYLEETLRGQLTERENRLAAARAAARTTDTPQAREDLEDAQREHEDAVKRVLDQEQLQRQRRQANAARCQRCGKAAENAFSLARQSDGRLLCNSCAETGDDGASKNSPPTGGGVNTDTNTTGGNPMDVFKLDLAKAAQTARTQQEEAKNAALEQEGNALCASSISNNQATLQAFAAYQESSLNTQALGEAYMARLNGHDSGVEYANSGDALKTESLQSS